MKISDGMFGELEVPKVIIRGWKKHKGQYGEIEEFISANVCEYLMPDEGELADRKLVDKDLAIFLRDYEIGRTPSWGGYFAANQFSFKDGGNEYTILAFGWNNENGEPDIHMIGYKEAESKKA